ncbi:TPA: bifunctional 4-hydroxy-2-oxoglutarate aldolase/2-dehydro-3-deoxy-phosphogluconate aldolase [Legionella pneumophila]|nr:bifunctional 4-hydroxy-2-oxoglutarate aldolase/2-dehydro-3-deoxy-phosphogluconate aldolase [Legionella pneumophila]HAU1319904.1 bifunctional 4-hydroxy-2-oxoglutarate aldolase/2-dehydro-3-deoxy-phosphogluconate aldolase [Legionella pneumophila]HBC0467585.1 bifunctional 4-hydroxy-2-oxoglutarate aldolase/2-dehydro-3-deoxy-phosphogluconate aldolase [Legionella pneumophila]HBD9374823.1 bifunctional 4-hydroxy-2-oxoglutarate aldolase/2-dehydro-3-deoxy-phosphogluconate aldolase [Legionella pneumophil
MSFPDWKIQPGTVFCASPVIPVIVINELEDAIPLADALFAGGIHVLEVTLRTPVAIKALELLINTFPDELIGAGTVITPGQLHDVVAAGARFAISPGQTRELLIAGQKSGIPLIPGVASVSELMEGLGMGYNHFKFFPAAAAGGIPMLQAISGVFPQVTFCPTGGINSRNYEEYLRLPNVACVGGSWIVPEEAIKNRNWSFITELCLAVSAQKREFCSQR